MISTVVFKEAAAQRRVVSIPLSHLSIELGHLYAEDFGPGYDNLQRYFDRIAPWVEAAQRAFTASLPKNATPRISTCFLIDDYFNRFSTPAEVIGQLRKAARASGLTIDYIAREAGCAVADDIPLAELVVDRLVSDPPRQTTGGRPPLIETGWLCNGQRTPGQTSPPAMTAPQKWSPPAQNGDNEHSIFLDVELWSTRDGQRRWSCAFLAAVWQLVRLGLLRNSGDAVVQPFRLDEDEVIPSNWDALPAVYQVSARPAPFAAYRTLSVLSAQFLPVEHAVRTILSQVSIERTVAEQLAKRSRAEGLTIPAETVERIGYLLLTDLTQ
jgi:hypothetical protein